MKKIFQSSGKTPPNIMLWNIVATFSHSVCNPCQSKLDGRKPQEEHVEFVTMLFHPPQQIDISLPGQSRLKCEIDLPPGAIINLIEKYLARFNGNF